MDCTTSSTFDNHPYYLNAVFVSIFPAIVILISIAFWGTIALVRKNSTFLTHYLVASVIVVLFLFHPIIFRTMISIFSCTEIDGDWWLLEE